MKNKSKIFIALACAVLFVNGCATLEDAVKARGTGQFRVYEKSLNEVWDATHEVLKGSDLILVSEDKETGQILGQHNASMGSMGERVAIFISTEKEKLKTRIEVVSKRVMTTNVLATNWGTYILEKLDTKLKK